MVPSSKAPAAVPPATSTGRVRGLLLPQLMAHCSQSTKLTRLQFVSRQMHASVHYTQAWTQTSALSLNALTNCDFCRYCNSYYKYRHMKVAHFNFAMYDLGVTMPQRCKLQPISDLLYLMPNVRSVYLGFHLPFVIQTTVMDRLAQWKQLQHVALHIYTDSWLKNESTIDFYQNLLLYIADNRGLFPKLRLSIKLKNWDNDDLGDIQALVDTLQLALSTGCALDCFKVRIDHRCNWAPPHEPYNAVLWSIVPSFSNVSITHLKCQPINVLWLQQVINELKPSSLKQITLRAAHLGYAQAGLAHISTRRFLRGIRDEQLSQVTCCAMPYWQFKPVAPNSNRSCAYLRVQISQILQKMPKLFNLYLGPSGHYNEGPFLFEWASFRDVIDLLLQRSLQLECGVQVFIEHCVHFASDLDDLLANLHETYEKEYCVATKLTWGPERDPENADPDYEGLRLWVTLLHARTGHTLHLSCI